MKFRRYTADTCPIGWHIYPDKCSSCDWRGIIYHSKKKGSKEKFSVQCKYVALKDGTGQEE